MRNKSGCWDFRWAGGLSQSLNWSVGRGASPSLTGEQVATVQVSYMDCPVRREQRAQVPMYFSVIQP